jgi:hypothetical protein
MHATCADLVENHKCSSRARRRSDGDGSPHVKKMVVAPSTTPETCAQWDRGCSIHSSGRPGLTWSMGGQPYCLISGLWRPPGDLALAAQADARRDAVKTAALGQLCRSLFGPSLSLSVVGLILLVPASSWLGAARSRSRWAISGSMRVHTSRIDRRFEESRT